MLNINNPLLGSVFNLLMSAYGGSGSGAESGFGVRPSNVEGPSMADGGFYSRPQGVMGSLVQSAAAGGGLGSTLGGALGSPLGPMGSKVGSLAGSMLGSGQNSGPAPLTPPPAPKPLSRVSPSDQFNIQRAVESLPPELREPFSRSFGIY